MTNIRCEECQRDPWRTFPNGNCVKCAKLNKSRSQEPAMKMSVKKGLDRRRRKHTDATLERRIQEAQNTIERIINNYCNCVPTDDRPCTACRILEQLRGE